jgi:hypothetical protein
MSGTQFYHDLNNPCPYYNVKMFNFVSDTCDGSSVKRPRVQTDERELKVPLERGWKRSTTILAIGKRGFIGEVLYFAPCGKKMKTIPDVMRVS